MHEPIIIGKNRTQIKAEIKFSSNGLIIILEGYDGGHIGTTAILEPYKNSKGNIDVSISTLSCFGHRDYELIMLFREIAKKTNKIFCIIAGIHIPSATKEEIKEIFNNLKLLILEIEKKI